MNFAGAALGQRRFALWALLLVLVLALLGTLVWLAGRYETSQIEARLEQDAAESVLDIRSGLTRNIQSFQALQSSGQSSGAWISPASDLLRERREIMRLERRSDALEIVDLLDSPYRSPLFKRLNRSATQADVSAACTAARRLNGAAYSSSYFLPQPDGLGLEVMDMCLPTMAAGQLVGYTVATYGLREVLSELVNKQLTRGRSLSFTEPDGTRLALLGRPSSGDSLFIAKALLDLPGTTLVLRLESRVGLPALFPNVLTALVSAMSLALLAVLFILARDTRLRIKVEHDLGEALAFRKAMEDSLLTGLRARDLSGRITYVNPAFCKMVGMPAKDLLNQQFPSPYWPPELADAYQQRQTIRLAGSQLPREGHESLFMRPDGTRFPVLIMEAPLINAVGKHTGWMSAILDVSEQRRSDELNRASQDRLQATARLAMVGEMASLLSHELNQPLAAISSYATGSLNLLGNEKQRQIENERVRRESSTRLKKGELIQRHRAARTAVSAPRKAAHEVPSDGVNISDLQLAMSRIAEQAERAGKVIKSVHDFVRRRDQQREVVLPHALLDAVMPLVSLQAHKLSVSVVMDVNANAGAVLCDRTMVEQVLLNLARNGMQAMQSLEPSYPRLLTLRVRQAASNPINDWVEFSVVDQGSGISPDVASKLFTPFFTTKTEGMGLGLSLCRTVIEQHGGLLSFSPAPPNGCAFSFTLPAASVRAA